MPSNTKKGFKDILTGKQHVVVFSKYLLLIKIVVRCYGAVSHITAAKVISNLLLLLGVSLSKTLVKRLPNQQSNLMNNSALKYSRLKNLKYDIQYLEFFNELAKYHPVFGQQETRYLA